MKLDNTYPPGGPRQPVYDLMESLGFTMSSISDKIWYRGATKVNIFGAGSMAQVWAANEAFECPLRELRERLSQRSTL